MRLARWRRRREKEDAYPAKPLEQAFSDLADGA
jgi:hypothetical protein